MIIAKNGQRDLSVAQLVHSLNWFYKETVKNTHLNHVIALHNEASHLF